MIYENNPACVKVSRREWAPLLARGLTGMTKNSSIRIHVALDRAARLLRAREHEGSLNPAQWQALRYISRCNRFSNTPVLLGRYLAATKGTVSQTLSTLARKGLIEKTPRAGGGLSLSLTPAGEEKLREDPANAFLSRLDALQPRQRAALVSELETVILPALGGEAGESGFGPCRACRYFRRRGARKTKGGPHFCWLFEAPLSKAESRRICAEFMPE